MNAHAIETTFFAAVAAAVFFCGAVRAEETLSFVSYGDVPEGRKAFVELRCNMCHQVLGDPSLPRPKWRAGPVLGGLNAEHSAAELAQAIVSPSHSMAPGFEPEADGTSPMVDLTRAMTVRQLIDVVAYLKDEEATDVVWPKDGR